MKIKSKTFPEKLKSLNIFRVLELFVIKRNDHENGNENYTNYLILEGTNTELLFTKLLCVVSLKLYLNKTKLML